MDQQVEFELLRNFHRGVLTSQGGSLLEVFVDAEADCIARLRAALAEHRLDEARRICHTLKGLAAGFDADALAALARAAELALEETAALDAAQLDELDAARRHLAQGQGAVVTAAAAG